MTPIALLRPDKPGVYGKDSIYDPNNLTAPGRIVPQPYSIINDSGQLFYVVSVDPTTYACTLAPAFTQLEPPLGSVISYGNDIFHLYYDNRVTPNTLVVESRCKVLGGDPAYYQILRYPNTPQAVVISRHYGVSGNYIDNSPPMAAVSGVDNTWSFQDCVTDQALTDNEALLLQVFNSEGSLVDTVTVHAKLASVVNAPTGYRPRITGISIIGNQVLGQTSFFVYMRQSLDSLFLQAQLTYDDGTTTTVPIDNTQCFLYGTEDFVASYPGLVQKLLVKYYLSPGELTGNQVNPLDGFISAEVTVTVLPHPAQLAGKISVIPVWNASTSSYGLRYYYYTLDRKPSIDITANVTVTGTPFNGSLYGQTQLLSLRVDLQTVDPVSYTTSTIYTQNVVVILQPPAALVRYIIRDSLSSTYVYGQDSSVSRRPVIYYDSIRNQYFVPASVFGTLAAFLLSFYTNANPPFDINAETAAPQPTHFLLRDPTSGAMIVPSAIPIGSYASAFNVIGSAGSYVKGTVIVEFLQVVGNQTLVLTGVPVDCYAGSYSS